MGGLVLALLVSTSCAPSKEPASPSSEPSEASIRWWSKPGQVALEPNAVLDNEGRVWATWINKAGKSAELVLACRDASGELVQSTLANPDGWIAAPALAPMAEGVLCVWETGDDRGEGRRLLARTATLSPDGILVGPVEVPFAQPALTPKLCRTGADRVELICVAAESSEADLALLHLTRSSTGWSSPRPILPSPGDTWSPVLAADKLGRLHVAWDYFDGTTFRVEYAVLDGGAEVERIPLDNGAGYQAHPAIALTDTGAAWIAWEEAALFGQLGGLRNERSLGLAFVDKGQVSWAAESSLPSALFRSDFPKLSWSPEGLLITTRGLGPSFATSARRTNAAAGSDPEREHTHFRDPIARSRVYRHERWRFFAAWWTRVMSFDDAGNPTLVELPQTEGDNLATETLLMTEGGPKLVFATDLRSTIVPTPNPFESSIEAPWRVGSIDLNPATGFPKLVEVPPDTEAKAPPATTASELRAKVTAKKGEPKVYFGDLHRHTHLSRCAGSKDGIATDVYRYARGPGALDFVAITDHFQHLQPWSWWRNQRDVHRFHAPGRLVVFSGLERASKERGHRNDIFLDASNLKFTPRAWNDFPETGSRWKSPPVANTISIPHMMGRSGSPWRWRWMKSDLHRLFEIYQGARGSYEGPHQPLAAFDLDVPEASVGSGLSRGHLFGFVAASDHSATASGLAGVWADEFTRAAIFSALQARSSFATTDFARAESAIGPLHSGADGAASASAPLVIRARGNAPVASVEVFKNGASWRRLGGPAGAPELVVLTVRRYGPYPAKPMHLDLQNAELASWHVRRRGEISTVIQRLTQSSLSIIKGTFALDLVFEVQPTAEPVSLDLTFGETESKTLLSTIALDRTANLEPPFQREQFWRIGPSLNAVELDQAFPDEDRKPGDTYYARVVFEDGNIAWTSPIRVREFEAEAAEDQ